MSWLGREIAARNLFKRGGALRPSRNPLLQLHVRWPHDDSLAVNFDQGACRSCPLPSSDTTRSFSVVVLAR